MCKISFVYIYYIVTKFELFNIIKLKPMNDEFRNKMFICLEICFP